MGLPVGDVTKKLERCDEVSSSEKFSVVTKELELIRKSLEALSA
jgi:hypothetical protein